ncbi:ZIP family metal transporter [Clostridium botulinum C/D]|nr:ZIP family metal transporter [Clostridium botulinum]AEB76944.1 zinc uptake transporter [Clostridium botulinum BKT015925]KEH98378.1 zinc transporter [Clostridium botulinum D str. 16868]KEI05119.1 zinc transporter [Clostridium botulinum C/D str. Sp77]MCD3197237.1 ZIP family metal transporter [Clostridium botulinum C/D]MCD3211175.1 ZIP family metal transporter [Clostridium botulinum C/D]
MDGKTIFIVTLASLFSLMGTMIGASLGIVVKKPSKNSIGNINGFAAGLMLSVVMMDLIPESISKITMFYTMLFCIIGILIVMFIDILTGDEGKYFSSGHLKVAFMAALALMLHNFPEGIIMGAGFLAYETLGIKMSLIIAIHDIPEGIAVSAPLMAARTRPFKIMLYAFITAFPTVIGSWIGVYIGNISKVVLGECLGIASGIMLYVVFGQMIPESLNIGKKIKVTLSILLGIILGIVITNVL